MYISGPTDTLALARDSLLVASCLCGCESNEEHDHTQKSTQSPQSLKSQFAIGSGPAERNDSTVSIFSTPPENLQLEKHCEFCISSAFWRAATCMVHISTLKAGSLTVPQNFIINAQARAHRHLSNITGLATVSQLQVLSSQDSWSVQEKGFSLFVGGYSKNTRSRRIIVRQKNQKQTDGKKPQEKVLTAEETGN